MTPAAAADLQQAARDHLWMHFTRMGGFGTGSGTGGFDTAGAGMELLSFEPVPARWRAGCGARRPR